MKNNFIRYILFIFLLCFTVNVNSQTITIVESRCVNTGEVIFSGTVGVGGPYQLSVISYPPAYTPTGTHVAANLPDTFTALFPGTYAFKIIDQSGVAFTYPNIAITSSYILPGNNDYLPVTTGVTTCPVPNGTISGTMVHGRPPYTYTIITGPAQAGITNVTGSFTGLPAGNYKVQAADSCQNVQTRDAIIAGYPAPFSITNAYVKIINCTTYSLDSLHVSPSFPSPVHYDIINYNISGDSIVRASVNILPASFTLFSISDVLNGRVRIKMYDDCRNVTFFTPTRYTNFVRDTILNGVINRISCDSFSLDALNTLPALQAGATVQLLNSVSGTVYHSTLPLHFKASLSEIDNGNIIITVIDSCGNPFSTNKIRAGIPDFTPDLKINCDGSVVLNNIVFNGLAIPPYTIKIKALFKNASGFPDSTAEQVVTSFPYTVTGITGNPNPITVKIEVTDGCGEILRKTLTRSFSVRSGNFRFINCDTTGVNLSVIGLYDLPVNYSISPAQGTSANTTGYFKLPQGIYTISATDSCGRVSTGILNLDRLWQLLPARQGKSCITGYSIDSIAVPAKSIGLLTIRQYDGGMPVTSSSVLLGTQLYPSNYNRCISCGVNDSTPEKIIFDHTLPFHTYSYVVTDSCGNADTISVTNGAGLQPFYSNTFSKTKCAGGSDIYANWRNDGDAANSIIVTLFDSLHNQLVQFNSGSNTNMNAYPNGQVLLQNVNTSWYTVEYSFVRCPQVFIDTVFSKEYVQPKITGIQNFTPCSNGSNPVIVTAADGVPPYSYEIVDTYPNHYTSAPQTSAVFNLPTSQSTATVRVLDACLNSAILALAITGATPPVIHSNPSVLSTCVLPFAINLFTDSVYDGSVFEWIKLTGTNAGTAVISTRPSLSLVYNSIADTGTYKVTVKVPGTCFDTSATFALSNVIVSCTGLPVTITNFTAMANGNDVKLSWLLAEQINILTYTIEWSTDGQHFNTIGVVPATNTFSYSMLHTKPANGLNYYRLKIKENTGRIFYSKIVTVRFNTALFIIVKPNPFKGSVDIVMELQKNSAVKIILYDAAGRQVYQNTFTGNAGSNKFTIDHLDKLSAGVYIMNISADDFIFQQRVLKN